MSAWPETGRCGAVDVQYPPRGGARAALVVVADLRYGSIVDERVQWLDESAPYRPGRVLPARAALIEAVTVHSGPFDLLIVDGYVNLDPQGRPGLGAHVHAALSVP